ncbi:MAG: type II toxin-antitoxin system HicB family antitoxin [Planctomycetes bacterium]|nr:type II toxin-antitoxin system HicB family antitoxin [Planctomycetota bacterium]
MNSSVDFTSAMKTTHEYRGYVFTVEYEAKDPSYVVDFQDIPEIVTSGNSLGEAFENACEALDLHLESLQKLGKKLPKAKHRLVVEVVGK